MLKTVPLLFSNVTAIRIRYNIMYYRAGTSYSDSSKTSIPYKLDVFVWSTANYSNLSHLPLWLTQASGAPTT